MRTSKLPAGIEIELLSSNYHNLAAALVLSQCQRGESTSPGRAPGEKKVQQIIRLFSLAVQKADSLRTAIPCGQKAEDYKKSRRLTFAGPTDVASGRSVWIGRGPAARAVTSCWAEHS